MKEAEKEDSAESVPKAEEADAPTENAATALEQKQARTAAIMMEQKPTDARNTATAWTKPDAVVTQKQNRPKQRQTTRLHKKAENKPDSAVTTTKVRP